MRVNGTLMNYYFHCKRQCYLHGNRLNLEDNSEEVQIGKALHEEKEQNENTEIQLENIRLDRLTKEYLTEIKKSDEIHHIRLDGRYLFPSYKADGGKALYCFSV